MTNERSDMLKLVSNMTTRDRQPIPESKPVKEYNTSEIYDDPAEYMTIKGIFAYTGVEMIK